MKIIGQPDSYSEMLERIFATTMAAGMVCTVILASASPAVKKFLDSYATETDIGPLKNLKALYVLIPLVIAVFSRALRLHDKISNIFRLRLHFDTRYILFPLAEAVGCKLTSETRSRIRNARKSAMYAVFYPYASFADPQIDKQLVRTAADNWGWFWAALEALFLLLVTTVTLAIWRSWTYLLLCTPVLAVLTVFLVYQWFVCRGSAKAQVNVIAEDAPRAKTIREYFDGI